MAARLGAVALVALCAIAIDAGAETRPDYGGDLTATLLGEPVSLDPARARSHAEVTVAGLIFDPLYRVDADGTVVPHLAAAMPEPLGDGRVRIALRAGVRFHDGSGLDADDVVASLRRLAKSDAGWLLAPVSAIDAAGDDLELTVRGDAGELAALLAAPQAAITSGGAAPKAKAAIGTGPFRLESIDRGKRRIVLVASDDHFAGPPYLERLELRWYDRADGAARQFEDGKLHLSARGATVFADAAPKYDSDVAEGPTTLLSFVGFGRAHADVTADRDFRRALHLGLARGGLSSSGHGERITPTADPLPLDLGGEALSASARGGDEASAKDALDDAAGRVAALKPARRGDLALEILVDKSRLDDREVAERVVRALDKLGFAAATITELSAAELVERVAAGKGDLWIGELAAPGSSPTLLWTAAFEAGGDGWARKQLASAGVIDGKKARAEFDSRLPVLPLLHRSVQIHHRSDVRGLAFDVASRPGFADLFFFGQPARHKAGK